jgi:hypothetical protein
MDIAELNYDPDTEVATETDLPIEVEEDNKENT